MILTNDNLVILLQDIQRHYFGKTTMFLHAYAGENINKHISFTIFDKDDNANVFTFYNEASAKDKRKVYDDIQNLLKQFN